MKLFVPLAVFCLFSIELSAQVGIGTSTPHASAKLEVRSTTQGFLPPRVSLTATNAASPVTSPEPGLLVYNIATNGSGATAVIPGFYYWGGVSSGWVRLTIPTDNAANVTGTVAVANGGTGLNSLPAGLIPFGTGNQSLNSNDLLKWNDDGLFPSLGVGVSSPGEGFSSTLDVGGAASFRVQRIFNPNQALVIDGDVINANSSYTRIYTNSVGGVDAPSPGDLILGASNRMRNQLFLKESNGFVGIRTNDPKSALHVNDTVRAASFIRTDGTSSQVLMANGAAITNPAISLANATGLPLQTGVSGTLPVTNGGTGVTTSTGSGSVVLSNRPNIISPTLVKPALDTPSLVVLTNGKDLPITGVSGLGTGVASFLGTPSSENLASAITGETGTGALVFGTSPTLTTPNIGDAVASSINGVYIGRRNATNNEQLAIGDQALLSISASSSSATNTAVGFSSMKSTTTGNFNTAVGNFSMADNESGSNNSALGKNALIRNKTGNRNTAIGEAALGSNINGSNNIAIGFFAGNTLTGGSNNIIIGESASPSTTTISNEITLGNSSITTIRANVQSISSLSDARDKKNIQDLELGLDFIKTLQPRMFNWDRREWYENNISDGTKTKNAWTAGFIAQELDDSQSRFNAAYLDLVLKSNPDKLEATYGNLIPVIVKAIQETDTRRSNEIEDLKKRIKELEQILKKGRKRKK